jgi:hypothetical protein
MDDDLQPILNLPWLHKQRNRARAKVFLAFVDEFRVFVRLVLRPEEARLIWNVQGHNA